MNVRDYNPATDHLAVEQIHKLMKMGYKLPDFDDPLFIVGKVYVNDADCILGAEFLKLQAETYLLLHCGIDMIEKTRVISHLSHAVEREAYNRGLQTLVAYIPEAISKKFSKRLHLLGWGEGNKDWITWTREL